MATITSHDRCQRLVDGWQTGGRGEREEGKEGKGEGKGRKKKEGRRTEANGRSQVRYGKARCLGGSFNIGLGWAGRISR